MQKVMAKIKDKSQIVKNKEINVFAKFGLHCNRVISWSKSGYRKARPKNEVIFNSMAYTPRGRLVWYGDIDLTLEHQKVVKSMKKLNIKELHFQFENDSYQPESSYYVVKFGNLYKHFRCFQML